MPQFIPSVRESLFRIATGLIVIVHACNAHGADSSSASAKLSGVDEYVEQSLRNWQVPGVAVGIVRGTDVIFAKGFGVREQGKAERIDARTLFQVASLSKAFTAAATAKLVDRGRLRWDDPIVNHAPELRVADPWISAHATVRDVLAHRTGVDAANFAVTGQSAAEVIAHGQHARSIVPYGDYLYSNLMYAAATRVVEVASGKTFDEFISKELFEPLGMSASRTSAYAYWDARYVAPCFDCEAAAGSVSFSQARVANVAMPHWRDGARMRVLPWRSIDNAPGAGAVVSNLDDLLKWVRFNLNDGRVGQRHILNEVTARELHTPQIFRSVNPDDAWIWDIVRNAGSPTERGAYALGWAYDHYRGQPYVSHGGGMLGMYCYVAMLPGEQLGVVVLTNGNQWALQFALTFWIFDRLLDAPSVDWSARLLEGAQRRELAAAAEASRLQTTRSNDLPPLPLERYAGDYVDAVMGPLRIRAEAGRLTFDLPGGTQGWLEHWARDTFRLHWLGGAERLSFVTFSSTPEGKVDTLSAEIFGDFTRVPAAATP